MKVVRNHLIKDKLSNSGTQDSVNSIDDEDVRGEHITEIHLSQKIKHHVELFDRWETTNKVDYSNPRLMRSTRSTLLPPITISSPKLGAVRGYESEMHESLELPQKILKEMKKQRRGRNLPTMKLRSHAPSHKTAIF